MIFAVVENRGLHQYPVQASFFCGILLHCNTFTYHFVVERRWMVFGDVMDGMSSEVTQEYRQRCSSEAKPLYSRHPTKT